MIWIAPCIIFWAGVMIEILPRGRGDKTLVLRHIPQSRGKWLFLTFFTGDGRKE